MVTIPNFNWSYSRTPCELPDHFLVVPPYRDGTFACASIDSFQGMPESGNLDERAVSLGIGLDRRWQIHAFKDNATCQQLR